MNCGREEAIGHLLKVSLNRVYGLNLRGLFLYFSAFLHLKKGHAKFTTVPFKPGLKGV